jgi:hypothetical protein
VDLFINVWSGLQHISRPDRWSCPSSSEKGEKGKAGIVVPSKDKLPTVIDTLIAAVRAGELDELFSQAAKIGTIGRVRKAA